MGSPENRTKEYTRVSELEDLLKDLNKSLTGANEYYLRNSKEHYSKIFVMGPLR